MWYQSFLVSMAAHSRDDRHRPRRDAAGGNEDYGCDPRNVAEIAWLQQRVGDLELQYEDQSGSSAAKSVIWDQDDKHENPFGNLIRRVQQPKSGSPVETELEDLVLDEYSREEGDPSRCDFTFDSPPVYDEYGDEEWYSWWMTGVVTETSGVHRQISNNIVKKDDEHETVSPAESADVLGCVSVKDHNSSPQNMLRPMLSSVPTSKFDVGKLSAAWKYSVTTIGNAKSDLDINGHHDIGKYEPNGDDATGGIKKFLDIKLLIIIGNNPKDIGCFQVVHVFEFLFKRESLKIIANLFDVLKTRGRVFFEGGEKEVVGPDNRKDLGPDNQDHIDQINRSQETGKTTTRVVQMCGWVIRDLNKYQHPFDPGGFG